MLQVVKVEVNDWVGQEVVKVKGSQKGRRAKVLWVGEKGGRLWMQIQYFDTKKEYYCSPDNYRLAKHWKEKPYKPKPKSVKGAQELFTGENVIKIGEARYAPIIYGSINPRLMRCLIDEGFLEKMGRLADVLETAGLSWGEYCEEKSIQRLPWFERNVYVYKILKDIS